MPTLCNNEIRVLHELVLQCEQRGIGYASYVTFNEEALYGIFRKCEIKDYKSSLEFLTDLGLVEDDRSHHTKGRRLRITANGFVAINEATESNRKDLVASEAAYTIPCLTAFLSVGVSCLIGLVATGNTLLEVYMVVSIAGVLVILGANWYRFKSLDCIHPLKCHGVCQWREGLPSTGSSSWQGCLGCLMRLERNLLRFLKLKPSSTA